ncbi:molybdopterin-dependent oxidoreductase [Streptomyces sp. NPDC002476]|uniref:molybdopterin-dependent oxidoreductase n=1 Tax=Streptomyces sp. NPDC002476 TaxID=3364648 RepID=UPI0036A79D47
MREVKRQRRTGFAARTRWAPGVAARLGLPATATLGPAGYYVDLAAAHGRRPVRVCSATACFAAQASRHLASETARRADVVLPVASWLEKEGAFVNFDRRSSGCARPLRRRKRPVATSKRYMPWPRLWVPTWAARLRPPPWTSADWSPRVWRVLPCAESRRGRARLVARVGETTAPGQVFCRLALASAVTGKVCPVRSVVRCGRSQGGRKPS